MNKTKTKRQIVKKKTLIIRTISIILILTSIIVSIMSIKKYNLDKKSTELCTIENILHPDLYHISFIESSFGKNKKHKLVNYGLNRGHRAAGSTGLMPITVKETIDKNLDLKYRYGTISDLSPDKITILINNNEDIEGQIANAHWHRLIKIFPRNERKRAYAWKNGITGALKASDEAVRNHPYVKKFIELKYGKKVVQD